MSSCQVISNIEYCQYNDEWGVGKYETAETAWKSTEKLNHLVIPKSIGDISCITFIGNEAFNQFFDLKTVEIYADIKVFCASCFANCPNLTRINIPSSTTRLESNAIQCYTGAGKGIAPGTLTVIIGINSKLKAINSQSIAIKEQIHIYTCDKLDITYDVYSFNSANVTVFSPKSFLFCGIKTTKLWLSTFSYSCPLQRSCFHNNSRSFSFKTQYLFMMILTYYI